MNASPSHPTPRGQLAPLALATLAALLLGGGAAAQASDWKWSITPYAWATDVGVKVSLDDRQVIDTKIDFTDLLDDVDTIAQVHVEAQHGAHGLMLDLFDVEMSADGSPMPLPSPAGATATVDSKVGMTILEAGGIYDPRGDQQGFALLYGMRILDQRATIDARFDLGPATSVARSYEADDTLVDGLLGVRYVRRFSPRWTGVARVDASAGGTDLTWGAGAAVAYAVGAGGRYAVTAGYRHMVVDFNVDQPADARMTLSGFFAGLRTAF